MQLPVEPDDERVQVLMLRMTGMNFDKVFAPKREPLKVPKYKLMTFQELKKVKSSNNSYRCVLYNAKELSMTMMVLFADSLIISI